MFYRIFLLFITFSLCSYGMSFQQVLEKALKESPYIQALKMQEKATEGDVKTAKLLPNPEVSFSFGRLYSQSGDSSPVLTSLSLSQKLQLWGVRKFSIERALKERERFKLLTQELKNAYISQLYKQFYTALFLKKVLEVRRESLKISQNTYSFIEKSFKLGEEKKINLLRARKELQKAELEVEKAKINYENSLKVLSSIAGFQINTVDGELKKNIPVKSISVKDLPQIKAINKQIEKLEKEISLQKALSKPQISVEVMTEEDPADLGKYEFGIGITSTLPVFNRNQGNILKLSSQKIALKQKLSYQITSISAKITALQKQMEAISKQIQQVESYIIPQMKDALKLAQESLKLKEITPFEFYSWKKEYTQTLIFKLELINELHQTYGELIKIGGLR